MIGGNAHWALRYNLAAIAALRGDTATANRWLDRAYGAGLRDHRLLALDPSLAAVRATDEGGAPVERLRAEMAQIGAALSEATARQTSWGSADCPPNVQYLLNIKLDK